MSIDLFIISTRDENHFGQFIFPKSVLVKQGILTSGRKEGKRAMRVYPPWDTTTSPQAKKIQKWQLEYFFECVKNQDLWHRSSTSNGGFYDYWLC